MSDANMNVAAFQHGGLFATQGFMQLHLHMGKTFSVAWQECRQDAFDCMRRSRYLQHPAVSAPEEFHPLAKRADMGQCAAAIAEQVFADGSQDKTSANTIEKLEAELLLEIGNLARQRGLTDVQAQRCLGDCPELGHGDEGAETS